MGGKGHLDLVQLDPVAPKLDLPVLAATEGPEPVSVAAGAVAGTVVAAATDIGEARASRSGRFQ
jgi:hypothetical protein